MFRSLSLNNFKAFGMTDPIPFGKIVGLFGTNSSGKSSVVQSLLLMKQTLESTDRHQVFDFGNENSMANLSSFREAVFSHDEKLSMTLGVNIELPKVHQATNPETSGRALFRTKAIDFSTTVAISNDKDLVVERLRYGIETGGFTLSRKQGTANYDLRSELKDFSFKRRDGRRWPIPPPVKFHGFPDETYGYFRNASFLAGLQLELETQFRLTHYLGPLREFPHRDYFWKRSEPSDMGRRGERAIDAMLASNLRGDKISLGRGTKSPTLEEHVAHWLKELGLISSFRLAPSNNRGDQYEIRVRKNDGSPEVHLTDVGFGVSQLLPILVLCFYAPEGSTLIFEQPEIHLHPSVQSGLADVFIEATKVRKVQIVFESHSEHLLRRMLRRVAEQQISPQDVSLRFFRNEDRQSVHEQLQVNAFGAIENWPAGFFGDVFTEVAETKKAAIARQLKGRQ